MAPPNSFDLILLAYRAYDNHKQLYAPLHKDEYLLNEENRVFEPYNLNLFEEAKTSNGQTVSAFNVITTWYADQKNGTKFQGNTASSGIRYQAYAFTAALNEKYLKLFPLGSYVEVSSTKDNVTRRVIVLITDTKGDPGIDLSKIAAHEIGYRGTTDVTLKLMKPKGCTNYKLYNKQPLAGCYPEDIYVTVERSDPFRPGLKGDRWENFQHLNMSEWRLGAMMIGMLRGIAQPYIFSEVDTSNENKRSYVLAAGPFSTKQDAKNFANNLCPADITDAAEKNICGALRLHIGEWRQQAHGLRIKNPLLEIPIVTPAALAKTDQK